MTRSRASRSRRRLLAPLLTALVLLASSAVLLHAIAPAHATVRACGCPSTAYDMLHGWESLGFPSGAGWREVGEHQWLYGGAVHQNREGQLPRSASYREYDAQVYTVRGQARGAKRIVIDVHSRVAWYTPNHYTDFYRM